MLKWGFEGIIASAVVVLGMTPDLSGGFVQWPNLDQIGAAMIVAALITALGACASKKLLPGDS